LSAGRGSSGWGPEPIRYIDIEAWSRLTGRILRPHEVQALLMIDQAYLAAVLKSE
jgi:hypothetical protein